VTLTRKKRAVEQKDVTVVATTPWLAECAAESAVFRNSQIEVIPNGLNTETFKSYDSAIGRNLFDLPSDAALVLFGAVSPLSNHRKGYDLLIEALDDLDIKGKTDIELVIFGTSKPEDSPDFGVPTHYTGYLYDEESLALLYSAVDVMVVPSRYEGFGQTISEAMACGTPVVAFDTTGPGDIIAHEETGYLASAYEPTDLAAGIEWILADKIRRDKMGSRSRSEALKKYKFTKVAEQHLDLYNSLVTG
jgi:glycosyltransferase involved in cell wall biosynthesis